MSRFNVFGSVKSFAPQTTTILNHLLRVGEISGVEAQAIYKCRSLTKRISEIDGAGVYVSRETKRDTTGQRYVRYFLDTDIKSNVRSILSVSPSTRV